jgi:hypothetical protein
MLVVSAIVNPNENPYKNLTIVITVKLCAIKKEQLTINCIEDPIRINFLLPYLSDNLPLIIEPKKIPR